MLIARKGAIFYYFLRSLSDKLSYLFIGVLAFFSMYVPIFMNEFNRRIGAYPPDDIFFNLA